MGFRVRTLHCLAGFGLFWKLWVFSLENDAQIANLLAMTVMMTAIVNPHEAIDIIKLNSQNIQDMSKSL